MEMVIATAMVRYVAVSLDVIIFPNHNHFSSV